MIDWDDTQHAYLFGVGMGILFGIVICSLVLDISDTDEDFVGQICNITEVEHEPMRLTYYEFGTPQYERYCTIHTDCNQSYRVQGDICEEFDVGEEWYFSTDIMEAKP